MFISIQRTVEAAPPRDALLAAQRESATSVPVNVDASFAGYWHVVMHIANASNGSSQRELGLPRFNPPVVSPGALAAVSGSAPAGALDRVELSPVPWPFGLPPPMPVPVAVLSELPVPAAPVVVEPLVVPGVVPGVVPVVLAASRPSVLAVVVLPVVCA
jgi:hypothetical protein